jgi:hypothetical protein
VFTRLWCHPAFVSLSEGEKLLAFYLLTGPQTNRLGLYRFSIATAAEDLHTVPATIKKRLVAVSEAFGWMFDATARILYIPSWLKWNPPENPNVLKGNLRDLNDITPCGLVDAFARNIDVVPETLRKRLSKG